MRLTQYAVSSTVLLTAVITNAWIQKEQFYATCVYLSRSNTFSLLAYNQGLVLVLLFGKLLFKLFFGQLRATEVEHLYEKSWFAITETCLAMSIFRDEFDSVFVLWLTLLLFVKMFHWLCEDRVDYMEQTPVLGRMFHVRLISLLALLAGVDMTCVVYAAFELYSKGPSMQLLFGFEFTILATSVISITLKYMLNCIEVLSEVPWERKSMYIFYVELCMDFIRIVVYLCFFGIVMNFYGLPLHIIRDLYLTFKSFTKRVRDMVQYHQATSNMNERYPDATPEELAAIDNTCIICREDMETNAKKLPCGHIFHLACLRSWLERQRTCPTCRRPVLESQYAVAARRALATAGANEGIQPQPPQQHGPPEHLAQPEPAAPVSTHARIPAQSPTPTYTHHSPSSQSNVLPHWPDSQIRESTHAPPQKPTHPPGSQADSAPAEGNPTTATAHRRGIYRGVGGMDSCSSPPNVPGNISFGGTIMPKGPFTAQQYEHERTRMINRLSMLQNMHSGLDAVMDQMVSYTLHSAPGTAPGQAPSPVSATAAIPKDTDIYTNSPTGPPTSTIATGFLSSPTIAQANIQTIPPESDSRGDSLDANTTTIPTPTHGVRMPALSLPSKMHTSTYTNTDAANSHANLQTCTSEEAHDDAEVAARTWNTNSSNNI
eukprot:CFRG1423T1